MTNLRLSKLLLLFWLGACFTHAGGVVTVPTEENLRTELAGGGLVTFATDGKITVTGTLIISSDTTLDGSGHSVTLSGGGTVRVFQVQPGASLHLTRLTIADGFTTENENSQGGAGILCLGSASATECTFSNNIGGGFVARGGAIFHGGKVLKLDRTSFTHNRSVWSGGAIYCEGVYNSTTGQTFATNCSFYANSSDAYPGGAVSAQGTFYQPTEFVNCTFAWNTNGAIFNSGGVVLVKPTLRNCILAYSVGQTNAMDIVDGGNNICSDSSSSFDNPSSLRNTDPQLGPPGNYGGTTWTVPLLLGSPATDALDNSLAPPTDQRGVVRPVGLRSDIGALEGNISAGFPVAFRFASSNYSAVEGDTVAQVDIERLGTSDGSTSVGFSAEAGSAMGSADFEPTNLTVTFAPGEMQKKARISILDDATQEGDETVLLSLHGPALELPSSATLTILDDDLPSVITNYTDADLRAAIRSGGNYSFGADGIFVLTNTIDVTRPTVLDASGHNVAIMGTGGFRLFTIASSGALTLRNVELSGGRDQGADGGLDTVGGAGRGGAILVNGGNLDLENCRVFTNAAAGGAGGLTSNPSFPTTGGEAAGGAVYVSTGILNATNTDFVGNTVNGGTGGNNPGSDSLGGPGGAATGAAICNAGGILNLVSNRFIQNAATGGAGGLASSLGGYAGPCGDGSGGAVFQSGGLSSIMQCEFDSNLATSLPNPAPAQGYGEGGDGVGGAICNLQGSMFLTADLFTANSAIGSQPTRGKTSGSGGAVANCETMQILDCTFRSNNVACQLARYGGAAKGGAILNAGILAINRTSVEGNLASTPAGIAYGGAIYNSGSCGITNTTLVSNSSRGGSSWPGLYAICDAFGGALFNAQGQLISINNTISGNASVWTSYGTLTPGKGGGVSSTNGAISVLNTILAANSPGSNSFGVLADLGHNLSSDSSCGFSTHGGLDQSDPRLGPLGYYGGATPTMPLLEGSPAIDAGALAGAPSVDQRGHNRPYGGGVDIGAFESSPPYVACGRVFGATFSGQAVVLADGVGTPTSGSGHFALVGLAPGTHDIVPTHQDYVFSPGSKLITTGPDRFDVDFHAFRTNALSPEGLTNGYFHVVFAGAKDNTFRILGSTLTGWEVLSTNTVGQNGLSDVFLPFTAKPTQFYRSITP